MKKQLLILSLVLPLAAWAQDSRIRYETYSKDRVYTLHAAVGKAALIQFEDDESVTGGAASIIGVGDSQAWNLGVKGNNIALKPSAAQPNTNIVVVTNKRTYAFELVLSRTPTYILRFNYPDTQAHLDALKEREQTERQLTLSRLPKTQKAFNSNYLWRGKNSIGIKPAVVWDDGRFTFAKFPFAEATPNVYKTLPDGKESIVNTHIDPTNKDTIVIEEVGSAFIFRLGESVIEIKNGSYTPAAFNRTGTSDNKSVRLTNGVQP